MERVIGGGMALAMLLGLAACGSHGTSGRADIPGVPFNTSTRSWKGASSDGSSSVVSQRRTGKNRFAFEETWTIDGRTVETAGTGEYDPARKTNIYTYSKPPGTVLVQTEEHRTKDQTVDTVVKSNVEVLSVGERITYTALP
jgi:hypothetical protein